MVSEISSKTYFSKEVLDIARANTFIGSYKEYEMPLGSFMLRRHKEEEELTPEEFNLCTLCQHEQEEADRNRIVLTRKCLHFDVCKECYDKIISFMRTLDKGDIRW